MSYADDQTDKALATLEKKISKEYGKAYQEMTIRANEYFDTLQDRYAKEYKAFQQGKYTEAEFKAWYQTQVQRGEGYTKMRDDLAKRMTEANKVASAYINDQTPSIYSLNANYTAYEIEKIVGSTGAISDFQLVNEQAIKNLIQNDKNVIEFRTTSLNPKRDYEWNSEQIRSAMISGIAQGKSIDKLADSFMDVMLRNRSSAIRNARTSFTSAQNAGRNKSAEEAEKMGIKIKKQWHSMEDASVRFSHSMLNGQIRDLKSPFSNGLMYPADSSGDPAEVYNCRCRIEHILPDYEDVKSVENFDDTKFEGETYQEWLKRKQEEINNPKLEQNIKAFKESDFTPAKTIAEAEQYAKQFADNVSYKGMSLDNANKVNETLKELTEKYPLAKKLEKIETSARGKAVASANYGVLTINPKKLGKNLEEGAIIFADQKNRALANIQIIKDRYAGKSDLPRDAKGLIKKLEDILKYDRWSSVETVKDVVTHEYGHIIADQYFGLSNGVYANPNYYTDKSIYDKVLIVSQGYANAKKEGYIYKLGKYGSTNSHEFFAETFNAREKGEVIPDYVKEMLRKALEK